MSPRRCLRVAVFLTVVAAAPAAAQEHELFDANAVLMATTGLSIGADLAMDTVPAAVRPSFPALAVGGTLGSFAGLVGGALLGERVGWGGGDDPGLISALIFGFGGSVLGTVAGMEMFSRGSIEARSAIGGGLAGLAGGLAAIYLLQEATQGSADDSMFFAYSIGQGTIAALLASATGG